jgi:hypothetical protein
MRYETARQILAEALEQLDEGPPGGSLIPYIIPPGAPPGWVTSPSGLGSYRKFGPPSPMDRLRPFRPNQTDPGSGGPLNIPPTVTKDPYFEFLNPARVRGGRVNYNQPGVRRSIPPRMVYEGAYKGAMEDWLTSLPKPVIDELKTKHGKELAHTGGDGYRDIATKKTLPLHKSIVGILKKHKVKPFAHSVHDSSHAIQMSFHTYHG